MAGVSGSTRLLEAESKVSLLLKEFENFDVRLFKLEKKLMPLQEVLRKVEPNFADTVVDSISEIVDAITKSEPEELTLSCSVTSEPNLPSYPINQMVNTVDAITENEPEELVLSIVTSEPSTPISQMVNTVDAITENEPEELVLSIVTSPKSPSKNEDILTISLWGNAGTLVEEIVTPSSLLLKFHTFVGDIGNSVDTEGVAIATPVHTAAVKNARIIAQTFGELDVGDCYDVYCKARIEIVIDLFKRWHVSVDDHALREYSPYHRSSHPIVYHVLLAIEILRGERNMLVCVFPKCNYQSTSSASVSCAVSLYNCILSELSNALLPFATSLPFSDNIQDESDTSLFHLDMVESLLTQFHDISGLCYVQGTTDAKNDAIITLRNLCDGVVQGCLASIARVMECNIVLPRTDKPEHPITNQIIFFCRELAVYQETLPKLCDSASLAVAQVTVPICHDRITAVLLEQLLLAWENECKVLFQSGSPTKQLPRRRSMFASIVRTELENDSFDRFTEILKHIFVMNNLHAIMVFVTSVDESCAQTKKLADTVESRLGEETKLFFADILQMLVADVESNHTGQHKHKHDRNKAIKNSFMVFNNAFELLKEQHAQFWVPSIAFRKLLDTQLRDAIAPKYKDFFDASNLVNFSQKKNSYVKYTPSAVDSFFAVFFQSLSLRK